MVKAVGIFTNTYEWCAEGTTPQIENLQTIAQSEMPYWYEKLKNRESIIIQDVEAVRDIMPQEYELLKAQNIHTEIAVPMIHKNSLIGFVGLDNPRIEDQATIVHLLEVVGLYIGNIWENIHMDELLRMEQGKVEEGRLELEKKQHFLEMHGITCDRAENGAICVEKYKKEKTGTYDAILMDMQMPVMGGLQATEMIRCLESKDVHEKIIAVTANAFETDIQKCREAGMDAHLSKPIDLKKLFRLLA